jgi:hypothetical protein
MFKFATTGEFTSAADARRLADISGSLVAIDCVSVTLRFAAIVYVVYYSLPLFIQHTNSGCRT